MKMYVVQGALSIFVAAGTILPAMAEGEHQYLSIVPPHSRRALAKPTVVSAKSRAAAKGAQPAARAVQAGAKAAANGNSDNADGSEPAATELVPTDVVAPKSFYSVPLEEAVKQYRSAPTPAVYAQMLEALKTTLSSAAGYRVSAVTIVKDNPYLSDYKPKVIETNGVRLWYFPKATERSQALLQWYDVHQTVVGVGRRKHVLNTTAVRFQQLTFPLPVALKDAGMVASKEGGRHFLIAGDNDEGALLVQAFKLGENGWVPSTEFLSQIPAFLTTNVSGRISFRGADLIYNVGKMIQTTDANGNKHFLPEAESASYKFWLKSTDSGYVVAPAVADEDSFAGVVQFMQAVQQSRTDAEKSMLADPRVASLPKYLGLQGHNLDPATRVVEMYMPPGHGQRFRLINAGKDDLIFDVGKAKGAWLIKAMYIAQPDAFLTETNRFFPLYNTFLQKSEAKAEAQEKKDAAAAMAGGSISGFSKKH